MGRGCNPSDLWTRYFTSSTHVATAREAYGEPSVVEIRRSFDDAQTARRWEEKVLRRMRAVRSPHWLNKGNGGAEFAGPSPEAIARNIARMKGVPRSDETKAKISAARKGVPSGKVMSDAEKEKLRAAKQGIPRSEETKAKLRAANLGKVMKAESIALTASKNRGAKRSEETKAKMRAAWVARRADK